MLTDQTASSGWTSDVWEELEAVARRVVEERALLRRVIPRGPDMPGVPVVVSPRFAPHIGGGTHRVAAVGLDLAHAIAPVRLGARFVIGSDQIGDHEAATRQVSRAARSLAAAEDIALFLGADAAAPMRAMGVEVTGPEGFVGLVGAAAVVASAGHDLGEVVALAIDGLQGEFPPYHGPYAVVWGGAAFSQQVLRHRAGAARGAGVALETLLGAGGHATRVPGLGPVGDGHAVIFALDPFALDVVQVEPPTIALVGHDEGDLVLRLQERLVLRVAHPGALRRLSVPSHG